MQLRPHQVLAVEMLRHSLRHGNKRPILAAPCSFGKTITAAYILAEAAKKGKRGIFICDRVKLVQQALEAFDREGLRVGVMQGAHERSNPGAPIQIASMQTLARRKSPDFDLAVVDECHTHYKSLQALMDRYTAVPFIGLSATPYSKGLGVAYDDLVVPITPEQLLDQGYLCPVDYYGGQEVDVSQIGLRGLTTGGTDYDPKQMATAIEDDGSLVGAIVENWLKYGKGRQTIAFTPSIKHSKTLVDTFNAAGIPAAHIDGYMDDEERQILYQAHDEGEFQILSCSRLLNTGYDAPGVSCLIDCFPTKSLIAFVQRAGRIMRTAEGKENAVYLDHAGNVARHGFAECIVPDSLDDGEKAFSERKQTEERKEKDPRDCPQCHRKMVGIRCKCGYEVPIREVLETDGSELKALRKTNRETPVQEKERWFSELLVYGSSRGYSEGWAKHKYREKFGVWPNRIQQNHNVVELSRDVEGFIKHQAIKWRMRNERLNGKRVPGSGAGQKAAATMAAARREAG